MCLTHAKSRQGIQKILNYLSGFNNVFVIAQTGQIKVIFDP